MFQETLPKASHDKMILSEIIEYVLNPNNPPIKIAEAVNITHDEKNIIMSLLEIRDLYNIKRLFAISNIIFTHPEILTQKDSSGKDVLGYFIEYATYDLIDEFIRMLSEYSSIEEKKSILSSTDNEGKTHLIMMCENKKFENLDGTFKHFIDLIATSCGLDFLYGMLTQLDNHGNNILMVALKNNNYKTAMRILELIPKTILDDDIRVKVQYKLMTQSNKDGQNVLILLSGLKQEKELEDEIIRLIKGIPSNFICFTQNDSEGHNAILLAILSNNSEMIDHCLSIISTMSENDKKIVLSDLCKKFTLKGENFISLCFKNSQSAIYIRLIEEIERTIGEQLIVECFGKTFSIHKNLLHNALMENDMSAILSIMKYLKLVNNISEDDKVSIAELITKKDNNNNSLLIYAVQKRNYQVCEMILGSAKEFCDPVTIKIMLNAKDKNDNQPYIIAKTTGDKKIEELIKKFSQDTGNEDLISEQEKSVNMTNNLERSHIKKLVTQFFN